MTRWAFSSYEERRAAEPRNRLKEKLKEALGLEDNDADEVVSLVEEMISDAGRDIDNRINQRGFYDPDY
jgi:hypothetical protein